MTTGADGAIDSPADGGAGLGSTGVGPSRRKLRTVGVVVGLVLSTAAIAAGVVERIATDPGSAAGGAERVPGFAVPADGELPADAVVVVNTKGPVFGVAEPGQRVRVSVTDAAGDVVRRGNAVAGEDGRYEVDVGHHDGRTRRIHAGSVVRVDDGSVRMEVPVELAGLLDEQTGTLHGVAPALANITAALHGHGSRRGVLQTRATLADEDGTFVLGFGRSAGGVDPAHPFRGHQVDLWARVDEGAYLFRSVQTPNLTLEHSRRHAGGGYLLPGDRVRFELERAGEVVETERVSADGDGVAQARFERLEYGDVLVMRYRTADGDGRSLRLLPMTLELLVIDPGARVVEGRSIPDVAVVAIVEGDDARTTTRKTQSDQDGRFSLSFSRLPPGGLLMVYSIADEDRLGVGVDRLHTRIPARRWTSSPDLEPETEPDGGPGDRTEDVSPPASEDASGS